MDDLGYLSKVGRYRGVSTNGCRVLLTEVTKVL